MILGIGTDIIAVGRIQDAFIRFGSKFAERILNETEIFALPSTQEPSAYCRTLAKRFAAKEAIAKALGAGIGRIVGFHDITLGHDAAGKPLAHLSQAVLARVGNVRVHLSVSDEKDYAQAFVVIEKEPLG